MRQNVRPIVHVPNIRAAVEWYGDVGFTVAHIYDEGEEDLSFAVMAFGNAQVMFDSGGRRTKDHRREVDLYVDVDGVDEIYQRLKDRVEIVEPPHDTFYGAREVIVRDLNGFWVTFAQPVASERATSP